MMTLPLQQKPRALRAVAICVALIFAAAMLCNGLFTFWVSSFIPTTRLKPIADVTAVATALLIGVLFWEDLVNSNGPKQSKLMLQGIPLALFSSLFVWAMMQEFFAGPASYFFHRLEVSAKSHSVREVAVDRADDFGGRNCRNRAILQGGASLSWRSQLCGIPSYAVVELRHGGLVKVRGTFTSYGIQGHYYALVNAPNPSVKGTSTSGLRPLADAPYLER